MILADIEFERELFSSANKLRGQIAPSEYKHYVLPLIFLRYLSLKFEQRRDELKNLEINSSYRDGNQEGITKILEDKAEYSRKGVFYIPPKTRWSYLSEHADSDNIKEIVDEAMEILESEYVELKGTLPNIYKNSNIPSEVISGLIKTFSQEIFSDHDQRNVDLLGRVYEYFISNFASTEGNRGGEFFTPASIVKLLVAMLEPERGIVYDPACGTGGMFVQSNDFSKTNQKLTFFGQEQNERTINLAKMNGILHGIDFEIKQGDTLLNDCNPEIKADIVISNPPFNMKDWGAERLSLDDKRLVGPVNPNNANYMWIQHILYHLKEGGTAGFVMANGALTSTQSADKHVRKYLIDNDYIDCVVQLPVKMFFGTGIPSVLVFLSKNRNGTLGHAFRKKEVLFIDYSSKGTLIGKKNRVFSRDEIKEVADLYRSFKWSNNKEYLKNGFYKKVDLKTIEENDYKLTPSLYAGIEEKQEISVPFEEMVSQYKIKLEKQFEKSVRIQRKILETLNNIDDIEG